MADDERRADQMAYLSKQDGDYLVAQGWAKLDRNSGVYYIDRVRDARRDDEDDSYNERGGVFAAQAARSPQDEGHEAGIEAAEQAVIACARARGWRGNDLEAWSLKADARAAVEGYLACASAPSAEHDARDGTAAVEELRAAAQAVLNTRFSSSFAEINRALDGLDTALRRFAGSPASTGDRAPDEDPPA